MDWKKDITSVDKFIALRDSGFLWEFYPTVPQSWQGVLKEKLVVGQSYRFSLEHYSARGVVIDKEASYVVVVFDKQGTESYVKYENIKGVD